MYHFKLFHIEKVIPFGNLRNGSKCPKPRSGHRIVADNGNVYSFGGYNPSEDEHDDDELPPNHIQFVNNVLPYPLYRELWKFNLASRTWVKLKPEGYMPEELASHTAVLIDNTLLVFGGTGVPFGASSSNQVNLCGLTKLRWERFETTGEAPIEQYGQAAALHDNYLYVVGGTTGFVYSIDVHRLNLMTRCWEELPAKVKPTERYRHEIAIKDNKIYVFGGGTANLSFGFKQIPVYDIVKLKWGKVKTYPDLSVPEGHPKARRCHGCVHVDSYVHISGGHDGTSALSDMWRLDLNTLQWTKLKASLPCPVHFHSSTVSPAGQLLVFGGVTRFINHDLRINDLYSMWIKIPPLREIAWLAICHYNPLIAESSREKLLEAGVPDHYLNRVDFLNEKRASETGDGNVNAISSFA